MKKIILPIVCVLLFGVNTMRAQTIAGDPLTIQAVFDSIGVSYVVKPSIGIGGNIGTLGAQGPEPSGFPGTYYLVFQKTTGTGSIQSGLGIVLGCNDIYYSPFNSGYYEILTENAPGTDGSIVGNGGVFSLDTSRAVQIQSDGTLIKFWGKDGYAYLLYVEQLEDQYSDDILVLSPIPFNSYHPPMPTTPR